MTRVTLTVAIVTFAYYVQDVTPGTFQAPPATVSQMYQPAVTASSAGASVTVAP